MIRSTLFVFLLVLGILGAGTGIAHFKLNLNVRIFHLVHDEGTLDLYFRTPMAYLVADKLGPVGPDGMPNPAPFTFNRMENGVIMHLVDPDNLRTDPLVLGQIAADSLRINTVTGVAAANVLAVRVHPVGTEPGFATRDEAELALTDGDVFPASSDETYVGDAVVDVHVRYSNFPTDASYRISSVANPGLPGQDETANLLLDYRNSAIRTYRARGLLLDPIEITGSATSAATTFVIEGVRHILEGLDHVLFVLCMILGAATLRSLAARVTGFTLGHTVTLVMGFFGFAPQGAWFIPAVETLIALSIIFAAADAVLRTPGDQAGNARAVAVTALIGLLHGFGFSFMLQNILKIDAPNVWQSLVAFNVGVEIGQLLIVAAVWPLVLILQSRPAPVWRIASVGTAIAASLIAAVWVIERAGSLLA
jgi:hypothetical protein